MPKLQRLCRFFNLQERKVWVISMGIKEADTLIIRMTKVDNNHK